MLLSETATVKWNSKIKKHYTDLGYLFTRMGDLFIVSVSDLTNGSNAFVDVECDYCHKQYSIKYYRFISGRSGAINKDCCEHCKTIKAADVFFEKYGTRKVSAIPGVSEKKAKTNIERYGAENPFGSDVVKRKIADTNLKIYGIANPTGIQSVQEKRRNTTLLRYGVEYYTQLPEVAERYRGENNKRLKADKTHEERERDRSCEEYKTWRKDVFVRDHFHCRRCGGQGHTKFGIQAHHIKNWSTNEELRYDVDNGITLCKECHDEFHKKYGKRNNSQEQIYEFLNQGKKVC